jgi:hypothetical protein
LCSRPITSPPVFTAECRRAFGEVLRPLASGHRCHRCHHFWQEGVWAYGGDTNGCSPCLWCGLKGALLYLGDSGDGDDKNHGTRLTEVLGADRSEGGAASGSSRDRIAEIRAGCAQGVEKYPESEPERRRTPIARTRVNKGVLRPADQQRNRVLCRPRTCCRWCQPPVPTYRATGTPSPQSSPPRGPRRIRALRWLLSSLRIRTRDA